MKEGISCTVNDNSFHLSIDRATKATIARRLKGRRGHYFKVQGKNHFNIFCFVPAGSDQVDFPGIPAEQPV